MIESYEPMAEVRTLEERIQACRDEWAELRRVLVEAHPEADEEPLRGRLETPPRLQRQ